MKVGVLALQGDFREHCACLRQLGAEAVEVRLPIHLEGVEGLILPGGESTTIGKLIGAYELLNPILEFARTEAVWGTCAGAILMARDCDCSENLLQLMDIHMERNAFGRQVDSFEIDLDVPFLEPVNPPYHAVFIRGPVIKSVFGKARALINLPDGRTVAAQQDKLLATSFHPELTEDLRFHRYFLEMIQSPSEN